MNLQTLILITILSQIATGNQEYILNSQQCKIPYVEPFNSEVTNLMNPHSYVSCNTSELLTYIEKNDTSAILHLRKDLFPKYSSADITCCYSKVTRQGSVEEPDTGIHISDCREFSESVSLESEIVRVVCTSGNVTVYENVHNPVLINDEVRSKERNDEKSFLSVLFIVVDSLSRLNFIRTMPETHKFFTQNDFVEMRGYTKTGENTYPNFMSFLTGLPLKSMDRKCKPHIIGSLDKCPMIWYDYRDHDFITAYAEDDVPITTFNYHKKGFVDPPTDYYFKPYIEATETLQIKYKSLMPYCTGPETAGERILNLAKDFSATFRNQSTFGIFWMNTFSHNELNAPYAMDVKMMEFFNDMKTGGLLDEKIVIFLSDHGIRFGDIRATRSGWFEQRMPTCIVRVPEKFKQEFQQEYKNLKDNAYKLTSTYDLHATLQHILRLSRPSYTKSKTSACTQCKSFFKRIPENRSCAQAGIPEEWCTCVGKLSALELNDDIVVNLTHLALDKLNNFVNSSNDRESFFNFPKCEYFRLTSIQGAGISEPDDNDTRTVFIVFQTTPSAVFLTTVKTQKDATTKPRVYLRRISNRDFCIKSK